MERVITGFALLGAFCAGEAQVQPGQGERSDLSALLRGADVRGAGDRRGLAATCYNSSLPLNFADPNLRYLADKEMPLVLVDPPKGKCSGVILPEVDGYRFFDENGVELFAVASSFHCVEGTAGPIQVGSVGNLFNISHAFAYNATKGYGSDQDITLLLAPISSRPHGYRCVEIAEDDIVDGTLGTISGCVSGDATCGSLTFGTQFDARFFHKTHEDSVLQVARCSDMTPVRSSGGDSGGLCSTLVNDTLTVTGLLWGDSDTESACTPFNLKLIHAWFERYGDDQLFIPEYSVDGSRIRILKSSDPQDLDAICGPESEREEDSCPTAVDPVLVIALFASVCFIAIIFFVSLVAYKLKESREGELSGGDRAPSDTLRSQSRANAGAEVHPEPINTVCVHGETTTL